MVLFHLHFKLWTLKWWNNLMYELHIFDFIFQRLILFGNSVLVFIFYFFLNFLFNFFSSLHYLILDSFSPRTIISLKFSVPHSRSDELASRWISDLAWDGFVPKRLTLHWKTPWRPFFDLLNRAETIFRYQQQK